MASTQAAFVRRLRHVYGVPVMTRREWGSAYGWRYLQRLVTHRAKVPADTVVEHITVTRDTGDFRADMRTVERIGYERFGSGISYNIVIRMRDGMVGMGQPLRAKGTHTVNLKGLRGYSYDQNYWARAIVQLGMPGDVLSPAARRSHVAVLACLMDTGHVTDDPDYLPHSAFAWKDCPTDSIRPQLEAILRDAHALRVTVRKREGKS